LHWSLLTLLVPAAPSWLWYTQSTALLQEQNKPKQEQAATGAGRMASGGAVPSNSRTLDVGELFSALPPTQAPPTVAPTQSSPFATAQAADVISTAPQPAGPATAASSNMERQLSATELIAKLTSSSARQTASSSMPSQPPSNAASNSGFLPSHSGSQLPPYPPGGAKAASVPLPTHPPSQHLQRQPTPPPLPPPESAEAAASSIMASLFARGANDKPAAKAGHAKGTAAGGSVVGSPMKPSSTANTAAVPSAAMLPAAPHAKGDSRGSGAVSGKAMTANAAGTVQNRTQPAGIVHKPVRQDSMSAPKAAAGNTYAGHSVQQTVTSGSDANNASRGVAQNVAASRREATKKLFDVLLQDDRFLDAVSDALDAVGLRLSTSA
jgi:hypothetical protein